MFVLVFVFVFVFELYLYLYLYLYLTSPVLGKMAVRENIGEAEGGGGRQDTCKIVMIMGDTLVSMWNILMNDELIS